MSLPWITAHPLLLAALAGFVCFALGAWLAAKWLTYSPTDNQHQELD